RIKVLYEGLEDPFASLADPCRQVFLLAKSPQDDGRVAAITAPIKLIRSYERPVGGRAYDLYHVEPTDRALAIFAPDGCYGAGN
ncbi:MAG: hypothetical protein ACE5FI_11740, partial [Anaerolineales bacterium]